MSTASDQSGRETRDGSHPPGDPLAGEGSRMADSGIWLDGDVLACACPECGGPMSVRLWLMVADCFRCGTSVELTEQQEQEALRLLGQQEGPRRAESRESPAAVMPTALRRPKPKPPPTRRPRPVRPTAPAAVPAGPAGRVPASLVPRGARAHCRDLYRKGRLAVFLSGLLRHLPAWLISLVVHVIALLLLSLWYPALREDRPAITLATSISSIDLEGQQGRWDRPLLEAFEFDDPGAIELESRATQRGAPDEESPAEELPQQAPLNIALLPDPTASDLMAAPPARFGRMFEGRDPQLRSHLVEQAGGTSQTEAAVARGLVFLVRHQNPDGSWSLHDYAHTRDCDITCRGAGSVRSDVAGTALALLPFLGAGQTHKSGRYREEVGKGLDWLIKHQQQDGRLWDRGEMYAHGQAAIVLSEAFALTGEWRLMVAAQKALDFIVEAQHPAGGWRYEPGQAGDTSVVGWELMALKSGQIARLPVPSKTFELSSGFLDSVQTDTSGGRYSYQPRGRPTPAMTAEALLCRQYLGWPREHPGLRAGVAYLLQNLPDAKNPNIYYWYYATQVMHHFGGRPWETWNAAISRTLVAMQDSRGHAAGSWSPEGRGTEGGYAELAGRIYMTSLAICTLEVYYRHMPIYGEEVLAGVE